MSNGKKLTQESQSVQELIVISSCAEPETPVRKIPRICWNTGEEKNCMSCYLSKGCKAKACP